MSKIFTGTIDPLDKAVIEARMNDEIRRDQNNAIIDIGDDDPQE